MRHREILILLALMCLLILNILHAQQHYIINGLIEQKIKLSKISSNQPAIRNAITIHSGQKAGEWKSFKNWNEGKAVVAENDSIVWMGTPVGLVRWNVFSGSYQTFDENNGLQFTSINSLAIDKTGRLWIAATQGLAVYAGGIFTHYNYINSPLPESGMEVVCVDSLNRIVVAFGPPLSGGWYQDGGIARFDGSTWDIWQYGSSIYWGPTFSMCAQRDTVWITGGQDLLILAGETLDRAPGWTFGSSISLALDYQDSLWVETGRKTLKRSSNGWQVVIDRDIEGMGGLFYDIWNDPRGGLWLSMRDNWWGGYGPYRLDFNLRKQGANCGTGYAGICTIPRIPGQFYAQHALSATSQFFASLGSRTDLPNYQTNEGGLYKFDGSHWEIFRVPCSLRENYIYGLGAGSNGDVYFSTPFYTQKTDGLNWETIGEVETGERSWNTDFRFAPNGVLFTNHPNWNGYSVYLTGLDFDGYGNLWGTYPLMKFNWPSSSYTVITDSMMGINTEPNHYRPQFMDVIVDRHEHVWSAAWYYGGVMFDQTNWHPIPPSDTTLPNRNYDLVFADSRDRIWFATNQWSPNYGFTIFDGKEWRTYYSPQRYTISYVYQIAEDNFGNVWLATGGGLLKYDGETFIVFDGQNSPLSLNSTSAVTVDSRGQIWVGTRNGLYVYNPSGPVELGPYSYSSPADSLTIMSEGRFAKASFHSVSPSTTPVTYQLQRGRGTHKFWTIAESEYSIAPTETIEIVDSSNIIGKYYYRIREVASNGHVRYSSSIQFAGGTPGVKLVAFNCFPSGNILYFRWEVINESFVERYEICRRELTSGPCFSIKSVFPDSSVNVAKLYEVQADTLRHSSPTLKYSLQVIYADSTRVILKNINIEPLLATFRVSQNYPNPFNSLTTFDIGMPMEGLVVLRVYDILGREVRFKRQRVEEGFHKFQVDMSSLPTGIYLYSFESLGQRSTGKIVLMK